jgi:hypothetical protein
MAGVKKGASCKDHLTNLMYFLLTSEHLLYLLSFVVSHQGNISCTFRNKQYTCKIQISPPCASANHTTEQGGVYYAGISNEMLFHLTLEEP